MLFRYLLFAGIMLSGPLLPAQPSLVKFIGEMSRIRKKGLTDATVRVDTILTRNMYAVGPVKDLRGEIIVWNGRPFVARLTADTKEPYVEKDVSDLEAIFLVYADVPEWDTIIMTMPVRSMAELQDVITRAAHLHGTDTSGSFPFLLHGKVKRGQGHIMFKDTAIPVLTPEVLESAKNINIMQDQRVQMVGFYSQHHQGIFTHHDSYLHIHYRAWNKYQAGHLDEVEFDGSSPFKLLLPVKHLSNEHQSTGARLPQMQSDLP